jgi:hypothetical protein
MRILFIITLAAPAHAQQLSITPEVDLKKNLWTYSKPLIMPSAMMYLSGACNGLMDMSRNHYDIYSRFYRVTNHQWHDPRISWTNKYKLDADGSVMRPLTPRFFGSTNVFVGTTDAWHAYQTGMLTTWTVGQFSYAFNLSKMDASRKKWYYIVIDIIIQRLAWQAGFHTTYSLVRMRYR